MFLKSPFDNFSNNIFKAETKQFNAQQTIGTIGVGGVKCPGGSCGTNCYTYSNAEYMALTDAQKDYVYPVSNSSDSSLRATSMVVENGEDESNSDYVNILFTKYLLLE